MILKPGPNARPHFFLIGFRAPPAGTGPDAERVGVLVARDVIRFDGTPGDPGKVRTADEPYQGLPAEGPFRYESEIATHKPAADVLVVDDLANFLTPLQIADVNNLDNHIAAAVFGTVELDRGAGFGIATALHFGWRSRTTAPRVDLAGREGAVGDPSSLAGFDPEQFDLPDDYDNAFNNGHNSAPLSSSSPFQAGNRLRFTDTTGPAVALTLTIPAAPSLSVSKEGQPLSPPLNLAPAVDTVVMDRSATQYTVVWRANFLWEPRFEEATLEVN